MITVFLSLTVVTLAGALMRRSLFGMEEARQNLNRLVLYAFLPALVFKTVMGSSVDRLFVVIPLAAAGGVLACLAVAFVTFHFLPIPSETKGAMMLASAFGNVTYLGLPVLQGIFPWHPIETAQVAVLFEVTKSSLNLTLGAMLAMAYGSREPIAFRNTVVETIKLPPIWALAGALLWKSIDLPCPAFLLDAAGLMAASVSGMMIFSLGMALRFRFTPLMALALPVMAIKLAFSPLIVSLATGPLGITGIFRDVTILEAAMPSQLLSFVIASRFKLDEATLAFVIMADTLVGFLTLPIVHAVLGSPVGN